MRKTGTRGLAASALLGALLLAGCGGNTPPAPEGGGGGGGETQTTEAQSNGIAEKTNVEIVEASSTALKGAESVRVVAESDAGSSEQLGMDLKFGADNSMSGWLEQDGARIDLIAVGGQVYFKGNELIEQQAGPEAANQIGDRWVLAPSSMAGSLTPFGDNFNIDSFADQVLGDAEESDFSGKQEITHEGQSAVQLDSTDGRFVVAATGEPYPLLLEATGEGTITFSEFGSDFSIAAPTDVVDLADLSG